MRSWSIGFLSRALCVILCAGQCSPCINMGVLVDESLGKKGHGKNGILWGMSAYTIDMPIDMCAAAVCCVSGVSSSQVMCHLFVLMVI